MQKEINKLLKRINVEKLKHNHKECVELYNSIGGIYSEISSYEEAIHYHEKALELSKTLGDRLNVAFAQRYIGEAKAALGQFYQAIEHIKKYLDLAQKIGDKVEIQRAWTTLGRIYLMQAQDMRENSPNAAVDEHIKQVAQEAEKRFQTALNLAESVQGQVGPKEFAQMQSGLLINLGLIKDICGQHGNSVLKFNRAIEICKAAKIKEDLFRCQVILASLFRQQYNVKLAVRTSEDALTTAKQIGRKLLICDAYLERGYVKILQRDFREAKRSFAQAYLEKSPNEEDHLKAVRLTKLAHLISTTHDQIIKDETASESRYKLCDKLGDLFVAVKNYRLAIEFYRRAFTDARACLRPKTELAKVLYSIAETYADDCQFEHALACYEKELVYREGNDAEQCQSLVKIAHMQEYINKEPVKISESYEKALNKANKNPKLMYAVLKDYVPFVKKVPSLASKYRKLEETLLNIKSYPEVMAEVESDDQDIASDELEDEIANVDDIITDDEDNDEVLMVGRRRTKAGKKFKQNEVGDTPLHEACIKGDLKRVESLLSQGHDVNPRDHAGWIPLHEACNHGHFHVAELLIENGADVNNRGLRGMSPLHDAATNGHFEIMRLLMRNGANVIALTDSGETVLSCFRDFKKRYENELNNRQLTEYKHLEMELLNQMDKCGYNLMEENNKNSSNNRRPASKSSAASSSALEDVQVVRPKSRSIMSSIAGTINLSSFESEFSGHSASRNPVKDYRDAIGTLKRKRLLTEEQEPPKKSNLPATFSTSSNTSAKTKEWLIDDMSRDKVLQRKRSNFQELIEFDEEEEELRDDEDDAEVVEPIPGPSRGRSKTTPHLATKKDHRNNNTSKKVLLESDDESNHECQDEASRLDDNFDYHNDNGLIELNTQSIPDSDNRKILVDDNDSEVMIIGEQRNSATSQPISELYSVDSNLDKLDEGRLWDDHGDSNTRASSIHSTKSSFNLTRDPLGVAIEDKRLLIPVKEEHLTIKWLKDQISERYASLVGAKPKISLSPIDNDDFEFYDNDLCWDVIKCNTVIAKINTWQLDTVSETFSRNCEEFNREQIDNKLKLNPPSYVTAELVRIEEMLDKLELTHTRFPSKYLRPIFRALSWRNYTHVDLTGSSLFFSTAGRSQDMLEAICSWQNATHLRLRCLGLGREHFEKFASILRLPKLEILDLTFNSIAYKCKRCFTRELLKLLQLCPKLKKLDLRHNNLSFMASLIKPREVESDDRNFGSQTAFDILRLLLDSMPGDGDNCRVRTDYGMKNRNLELLTIDQNDYAIYSSRDCLCEQ